MNQQRLPIPIDVALPDFRTGDLVLMHGVDQSSQAIQYLTNSIYSHVAMVVLPADIGLDLPEPLLWESTPMNTVKDVELHFGKKGPTLVPLKARIVDDVARKYDSIFAARHLNWGISASQKTVLIDTIAKFHDREFPSDKVLIEDWLAGRTQGVNPDPDFKSFFCSELVAVTYETLGLLPSSITPNFFAPADFSEDRELPLLQRATLGPELFLDPGPVPLAPLTDPA